MTDDEFLILEKKNKENDSDFCKIVQRYFSHPAVHHGMDSVTLRRLIYPVIFSGKSDEDIIKELDRLAPPGRIYF